MKKKENKKDMKESERRRATKTKTNTKKTSRTKISTILGSPRKITSRISRIIII